jgi:NAD(P)-dependent dehydrogenase (short-subunit alcohol dehydrogenase family)
MTTRVALITGSGRGIGRATALALAARGHAVIVAARTALEVERTQDDIRRGGGRAEGVVADLTSEADVTEVFNRGQEVFGRVSVLVNNAGSLEPHPVERMPPAVFDATLASNLRAAFLCSQAAFFDMKAAGGGRIVNVASLAGVSRLEKFPGLSAYTAAKSAIAGLTESLAAEGRAHNITAICIAPGAVDTVMLRTALPDLQPGATPEQIARVIAFLASDAAAPLNGLTIPLLTNA